MINLVWCESEPGPIPGRLSPDMRHDPKHGRETVHVREVFAFALSLIRHSRQSDCDHRPATTTVSKAAAGWESNRVEGSDGRGISAFLSKTAAVAACAISPSPTRREGNT